MSSTANDFTTSPAKPAAPRAVLAAALVMAVLGAGVVGVRVKQAVAKKEKLAAERATAQAALTKKAPSRVLHPAPATWAPHVELTGTLKPWRDADVGFELGGRLLRVNVSIGDRVAEGAPLAILDASRSLAEVSAAEAQARAAEASLALAQDHLQRTEALAASKSIPEAQAEQARQQVALSKAQLEGAQANARLAKTGAGAHAISAPFRGIVTRAPTAAGSVVLPGAPLVHIEDTSRLRLSATVGEDDVPLVSVGAAVALTYRDRTVSGKVVTLVPSLDPATRRAPLEVEVPNELNPPLLAWSFVRATIAGKGEIPVLRLPASARRPGSQDEVFKVVDGGKVKVLHVAHAVAEDGAWLVTNGVAPTDVILDAPDSDLRDGDTVELAKP